MSLKSGRHGIGIENLDWKTGKVKVPTPAGQIVKTFEKDFALSTSATNHLINVSFTGFVWNTNYVPLITLICPSGYIADLSLLGSDFIRSAQGDVITGMTIGVKQSSVGSATDKGKIIIMIVNKA